MKGECPFCYGKLIRLNTEDTQLGTKVNFSCPDMKNEHEENQPTDFFVYVDFSNLEY